MDAEGMKIAATAIHALDAALDLINELYQHIDKAKPCPVSLREKDIRFIKTCESFDAAIKEGYLPEAVSTLKDAGLWPR